MVDYKILPYEPLLETIAVLRCWLKNPDDASRVYKSVLFSAPNTFEQEPCGWQSRFITPTETWGFCSKEHYETVKAAPHEYPGYEVRAVYARPVLAQQIEITVVKAPRQNGLAVWYGPMPESNGKTNWTAILYRKNPDDLMGGIGDGYTIDRSEYPDRVRYEADRVRHLIGELKEAPFILDYDDKKHSGYEEQQSAEVTPEFLAILREGMITPDKIAGQAEKNDAAQFSRDPHDLADELYSRGYSDCGLERDYDPRGGEEWQAVVNAIGS